MVECQHCPHTLDYSSLQTHWQLDTHSGMVDVNGAGIAVDAPFGGFKHSGIGREAGEHGLEEFLEVKAVGGWS